MPPAPVVEEPVVEEVMEAEVKPKKKRAKSEAGIDDQPMLF
jgi:hypothetical protein